MGKEAKGRQRKLAHNNSNGLLRPGFVQKKLVQLAPWFAGAIVNSERRADFLNYPLHKVCPRWIIKLYLRRIHFPRVADVLINNGSLPFSEWSLATIANDSLCFRLAEWEADVTDCIQSKRGVRSVRVIAEEGKGTFERSIGAKCVFEVTLE